MKLKGARLSVAGSALGAALLPTIAMAQTAPSPAVTAQVAEKEDAKQPADAAPAPAGQESQGVGDIVVTAQRVSERLQRVPLAVSATSGAQLQKAGITSLAQFNGQVPGLVISQNVGVVNLYIRGVGSSFLTLGSDSSVALYEDGVYVGRPRSQSTAFMDIDRIEVLRGPQGTLYGRNANGGAINIITRKPTDTFALNAEMTGGNYGYAHFEGGVGGPIVSDLIKARLAVTASRRDGFGENIVTHDKIDNLKEIGLRGTIDITPAPNFDYSIEGEYYRRRDRSSGLHYLGAARPDIVPLGIVRGGFVPTDERDIASDTDPQFRNRVYGITGTGTWHVTDGFEIKSITGYRNSDFALATDADATSAPLLGINYGERAHQFNQDVQLTYKTGRLTAIAGGSYFHEEISGFSLVHLRFLGPAAIAGSGPGVGKTDAYAGYGQLSYHLTDKFTLTASARYSDEHRKSSGTAGGIPVPSYDVSFHAVTPKFTADYKFDENNMVYALAGKGFKSGFLLIGSNNPPVRPETIWDYELGYKGRFLDNLIQLNLAGFYYDYKNLQVTRFVNNVGVTENAAKATIKGLEAEIGLAPWRGAQFNLSASYLHARFDQFITQDSVRPALGNIDVSGNKLPFAPSLSGSLSGQQQFELAGGRRIILNLSARYVGRQYYDAFNVPSRGQAAYATGDGRLTYVLNDQLSFSLWTHNVTNKLVKTVVLAGSGSAGFPLIGAVNEPRTFGGTISFKM